MERWPPPGSHAGQHSGGPCEVWPIWRERRTSVGGGLSSGSEAAMARSPWSPRNVPTSRPRSGQRVNLSPESVPPLGVQGCVWLCGGIFHRDARTWGATAGLLRGDEPFSQVSTNSCACSGPAEMRCPQLTSQGPGACHGGLAQEATGQQGPSARPPAPLPLPHFLCPSLPPPALGLVCGPHAPSFLFAASQLLSPSFQIPKRRDPQGQAQPTDPWTS